MKKYCLHLFWTLFASAAFSQDAPFNMSLVGQLDYQQLHQAELNDCWGYADETGIEYAIVGTTKGTSIVSLENPAQPVEVFWLAGPESIWRDIQVWDNRAYITTEAPDGLKIIDMSPLPQSANLPVHTYSGPPEAPWYRAHDIFIDSEGFAYILGASRGSGGIIILDLNGNPDAPVEVGVFDQWYCHDAFAQGDKLYGAHISDGFFSIIDISDRSNPVLLNTQITPNTFTHNIWVTTDFQYAVTTDEVAGAFLGMYDVSDPQSIVELDRIRSNPGTNVIPHNAFILNDSIIISSYYTDGITAHSMKRPGNLVQIGSFDTHPLQNGSFNGSWGVYPFLPSGLLLASDMQEGLFVIQPDYVSPAYYEGLVRDAATLAPLSNVSVTIQSDDNFDFSGANGDFAVGSAVAGTKSVTFSKAQYFPQTIAVPFVNGQLLTDTIDLVMMPSFPLTVKVVDAATGNPVIGANVRISVPEVTAEGVTDGFGEHQFTLYYTDGNFIEAGKWGYRTKCQVSDLDASMGVLTIALDKGFYDDFTFDFGWTALNFGATSGLWERVIPLGAADYPQITPVDIDYDCGERAWVTGNGTPESQLYDEVNNGRVVLQSPLFDLSPSVENWLHFSTWFHCSSGQSAPDDTLQVFLTDNTGQKVLIDQSQPDFGNYDMWVSKAVKISDFLTPTADMQLSVEYADLPTTPHINEAGFDGFFVADHNQLGTQEKYEEKLVAYPNPATGELYVSGLNSAADYVILSADGRQADSGRIVPGKAIDTRLLTPGIWFLQLGAEVKKFIKE